jgi:RNA-directed DNA polymerase
VWFEEVVKVHCKGKVILSRYADDFVCAFEVESDAQRFYKALPQRLAKYGLEVAVEKTNILRFDKDAKTRFEFLGFEFRWGLNRWGKPVLKRRTARNKYRASIAGFTQWCKKHCRLPTAQLFAKLNQKLRGYWNYYGLRGNYESLSDYFYHVTRILLKRLNRRSQHKSYTWTSFGALLKDFPLIKPHICHSF